MRSASPQGLFMSEWLPACRQMYLFMRYHNISPTPENLEGLPYAVLRKPRVANGCLLPRSGACAHAVPAPGLPVLDRYLITIFLIGVFFLTPPVDG